LKHNGNDFGVQEIQDHGYTLTTEYVKRQGGENGGDWSARITATDQVGFLNVLYLSDSLTLKFMFFRDLRLSLAAIWMRRL